MPTDTSDGLRMTLEDKVFKIIEAGTRNAEGLALRSDIIRPMAKKSVRVCTKEIDRLADFLMENYQAEIGKGDPINGESAVNVAIRLLQQRSPTPNTKVTEGES